MVQATALALVLGAGQLVPNSLAENTQNDSRIQAELTKSLSNKRFKDVKTSVQDGVVALTGTVEVYGVKADAEKEGSQCKECRGSSR